MGIDISGGMFVGAHYEDIEFDEDNEEGLEFYEWIEENELRTFSPWYDALPGECFYGFTVADIPVRCMDGAWFKEIKRMADKFKEITGAEASLIGMQDVT